MKSRIKLGGFTLIELMVAILIGSMVLAAIISLFVTMIKADNDNLKAIRLNQELRAAMSLITRDIRRAGANQNAVELYSTSPPTPPTPNTSSARRPCPARKTRVPSGSTNRPPR
jgi:prepilin-type N-terminal cleavage/methylation domain-containing protein